MKATDLTQICADYLDNNLYESDMNFNQVNSLVTLFRTSAKQHPPQKVFEQMFDTYSDGNVSVAVAISNIQELCENSLLYSELKKLNSERMIETSGPLRIKNYADKINALQKKMAISCDGVDVCNDTIMERSAIKIPEVFQSKASVKTPVKLKRLDFEFRY